MPDIRDYIEIINANENAGVVREKINNNFEKMDNWVHDYTVNLIDGLKAKDVAQDAVINGKVAQSALNATNANVTKAQNTADKVFAINPYENKAVFDASGNWVCPAGVTRVGLFLRDGGTGGTGSIVGSNLDKDYYVQYENINGYDAVSGHHTSIKNIPVVPGQSYQIIVGAGGEPFSEEVSTTGNRAELAQGLSGGASGGFGKTTQTDITFRGRVAASSFNFYARYFNDIRYTYSYVSLENGEEISVTNSNSNSTYLQRVNLGRRTTSKYCEGYKFNLFTCEKITTNGGQNNITTTKGSYTLGKKGGNGQVIIYY